MKTNNRVGLKSFLSLIGAAVLLANGLQAGVCKIGTTEYDTLQDALYAATNINKDVSIVLTADIDVASENRIPSRKSKQTIIDGDGRYAIRQKYAGSLFYNTANFARVVFRDVTICGGGETYQTDSAINGVVLAINGGACSLTLDTGCVISNFVSSAALFDVDHNNKSWNIRVNPGVVIAHNRSAHIFRMIRWSADYKLEITGGDFFDNTSANGTIAYFDAFSQGRTADKPILLMTGGRIHHNSCTGDTTLNGLFYCDYGPMDVSVAGGEICDNTGTVFHIRRGAQYQSRVHVSGGKVYGNTAYAVYDYQSNSPCSMFVSGDAIVAGNGSSTSGFYEKSESTNGQRLVLEGDFTGYAQLSGTGSGATHNIGYAYATNALDYVGAENIHLSGDAKRVLVTDAETGNLVWQEPKTAKIGTTEYATLSAALSAAGDGQTITLLRDSVETVSLVPPANKAITVDGDGHRIFRSGAFNLVSATTAGGNLTFQNVQLDAGRYYDRRAGTNDLVGAIVCMKDGVAATVTLGAGTVLVGGNGTNELVHVASGATVNLDGAVVTGQLNKAVCVAAGGTLGVKGATLVRDNVTADVDVADGSCLVQNGDLTGSVHVTVAGVEPYEGQTFGRISGDYTGFGNFVNPSAEKIYVFAEGGLLTWRRKGLVLIVR